MRLLTLLAALLLMGGCRPSPNMPSEPVSIVPRPAAMVVSDGRFVPNGSVTIVANGEAQTYAELLAELIRASGGPAITLAETGPGDVSLAIEPGGPAESYTLEIGVNGVLVTGADAVGVFYGVQTLRQLLPNGNDGAWSLPQTEISDAPRFGYRGLHLDVGRHFFPVSFVKKYLDWMALYKLNTFHWHLTEDQGWRIEIERYPLLTEIGSCRAQTVVEKNFDPFIGDGTPHCGFYTQDEIREVVAYAAARHITVIPEIEMPGHSRAALAAYPELACTPGPFEVGTTWGVYEDVYCPKEETFEFLEGVLTEVLTLFPSTYIHIGGDEVPKKRWEESPLVQDLMRREGLADAHEVQSWFVRRIERFLNANGRRLIGWDEILEGGLAPNATVMSWRGVTGGVAAAKDGHDVIMSPNDDLYFDHYQAGPDGEPFAIGGMTTLEDVYAYEPVPAELTSEEAKHVLGAQANVWTEYMVTEDHVEYMIFPRVLALSEVLWTPREHRAFADFVTRLPSQLRRLEAMGVNYRTPEAIGRAESTE